MGQPNPAMRNKLTVLRYVQNTNTEHKHRQNTVHIEKHECYKEKKEKKSSSFSVSFLAYRFDTVHG